MNNLQFQTAADGAQLTSLKFFEQELLWQGQDGFWRGPAPVLFPVCGFIKNGSYILNRQSYSLATHGFARNMPFTTLEKSTHEHTYQLESGPETFKIYPFSFSLTINYKIFENSLKISYKIKNFDSIPLPFSIGWHPAFNIDENSHLKFSKSIFCRRQVENGLIGKNQNFELPDGLFILSKNSFQHGGIVLENFQSQISLITSKYEIDFKYQEFPNLVLWGQPGADFVCVEPWFGLGDTVDSSQQFSEKEYLLWLPPNEEKTLSLSLLVKENKSCS